ncbi:hypothetical protein XA68_11429 [Ophiocordyceps unilateralis]|uniref:Uncharacterized protein n=1 Tax=Ophiocordyceps unilateralis TaxID=268505 RepID=A0A2A9PPS8_OPHUN|nr:hypothetical protein XA68_11429 [Ophiocordyceps unilateralis]
MIHQLAARKAIEELEEKGGWVGQATDSQGKGLRKELESKGQLSRVIRREAARLGVRYQVAGKWCSFVAVNNDDGDGNQDKEDKEMLGTFEVVHREEGSVMGMAATTCFMAAAPVGTGPSLFGGMTGGGGNSPGIQRVCLRGGGSYANCSDCSDEDGVEIQCLDDGDCEGAPNSGSIQNRGGTDDNNVVSELALLQTFVGSWPWSKPLEKMLGLAKEETMRLKNVKADDDDDDGQVLATLCVILFLKQTLAGDKEVWELMVEKAQEWLEKQTGEKAADLEDWFLEARL